MLLKAGIKTGLPVFIQAPFFLNEFDREVDVKMSKKGKKSRITVSVVTPAYGGFRRYELDTVADWGRRIFLFKEFVQGRSETRQVHAKTRQVHANVKTKKKENH